MNVSFAIVEKEMAGGYVSNEFLTFEIITDEYEIREILEYIVFYLNSLFVLSKVKSNRLVRERTVEDASRKRNF